MKILDRYIIREYLKLFFLILLSIISIYLIIDFFGKIRMFISNNATIVQMASHFFFMIPTIVSQTTPAIILLATLMTFGTMSKNNEIVAVKANGVSLYRLAFPLFIICVIVSIALFLFSEFVTPRAFQKAEHIRLVEVQKQESMGIFKQNEIWYRGNHAIYNFRMFDAQNNALHGITIYYLDPKFRLLQRIDAEKAQWQDGKWIFQNVLIASMADGGGFPKLEKLSSQTMNLPENRQTSRRFKRKLTKWAFLNCIRIFASCNPKGMT